jgi:hypothetical protein
VEALYLQAVQEEVLEVGVQLYIGVVILKVEVNQMQDNRVRVHQRQGTHNLSKEQVHRKAPLHKEMMAADSTAAVLADHDDKMTLERME